MRKGCLACAIKHVAQAQVLMDEAKLGYPNHRWLACGHLAEAESELLAFDPELARQIRSMRLAVTAGKDLPYDDILNMLLLAKDKTELSTTSRSMVEHYQRQKREAKIG